jgi:hypothetical protein
MANQKLPLPLFYSKHRVSQPGCSTHYFHFIATVSQKTDHYALVCENQPLSTFRSHGFPARCPACAKSTRSRALLGRPDGMIGLPGCWKAQETPRSGFMNGSTRRLEV